MNINRNRYDLTDTSFASEQLGIPKDRLILLRRGFSPDLSAEEHEEVFPLDLGPAPNIAAFGAIKDFPNSENFFDSKEALYDERSKLAAIQEWGPVHRHFSGIMTYASEGQTFPLKIDDGSFLFHQSFVLANESQRGTEFHTDNASEKHAFTDYWLPPCGLLLHLRDIGPETIYIRGIGKFDEDLVDRQAIAEQSPLLAKFYRDYVEVLPAAGSALKRLEKDLLGEHFLFHSDLLKERARDAGKLVTFPAGHVIACTKRTLHAGQTAPYDRTQTFALGQSITKLDL